MKMIRGNLAIATHQNRGKELLLFRSVSRAKVEFAGKASYISHHEVETHDRNGERRSAIVFELLVDSPAEGEPDVFPEHEPEVPPALLRRPLSELRQEAVAASVVEVPAVERRALAYKRSNAVKAYVLSRAAGKCEGCGTAAPFFTPKKVPYLEPHHIRRRADSGPDHPQWVIALCPNCHKRVHYGVDGGDFNIQLAHRVALIESAFAQ